MSVLYSFKLITTVMNLPRPRKTIFFLRNRLQGSFKSLIVFYLNRLTLLLRKFKKVSLYCRCVYTAFTSVENEFSLNVQSDNSLDTHLSWFHLDKPREVYATMGFKEIALLLTVFVFGAKAGITWYNCGR